MFASELALQERHAKSWSTYILPEASKDGIGFQPRTVIDDKLYALKFWEKKKESDKHRPQFPATFGESLSFFIARVGAPINITLLECQLYNDSVGALMWHHFLMIFGEYLPVIYYVMFLSIYAPKEHLYTSKMMTIFYGCSMQIILAGFLSLLYHSDILALHLVLACNGLRYNAPWNRCDKNIFKIKDLNVHCYELDDLFLFSKQNVTKFLYNEAVFNYSGHYFQSSQSLYLRERYLQINDFRSNLYLNYYYFVIWATAGACINRLFKKLLWQVIDYVIWIMVFIYVTTLFYTHFIFWYEDLKYIPIAKSYEQIGELLKDLENVTFPIFAPPIIHITLARTRKQKKLGFHSTAAVLSIFFFKLIQSVALSQLKLLSDARAGIVFDGFPEGKFPLLFLYPTFFKSLYLGPMLGRLFFVIVSVWEFVSFIMVYQCLVEVIVCEWPIFKRWHISLSLFVLGWAGIFFSHLETRNMLFYVSTILSSLTEIFVIFWLYPLRRLKEDICFYYYGDSISKIRMFILYFEKILCMTNVLGVTYHSVNGENDEVMMYVLISSAPVFIGAIWKIIQKKSLNALMRPVKFWGPSDYRTRQYRKHFESRTFIGSMGPRYFCRHMLERAEQPSYRLDVEYADKAQSLFKSTSNILKDKLSKVSVSVPLPELRSSQILPRQSSQQLEIKETSEKELTALKIDDDEAEIDEKPNKRASEIDKSISFSTKDSFVSINSESETTDNSDTDDRKKIQQKKDS